MEAIDRCALRVQVDYEQASAAARDWYASRSIEERAAVWDEIRSQSDDPTRELLRRLAALQFMALQLAQHHRARAEERDE